MLWVTARTSLGTTDLEQWEIISGGISIFLRTGSLTPGLTNSRFSHLSQSPEINHASWPDIRAKVDLCVANWDSLAMEVIDFSYFPQF